MNEKLKKKSCNLRLCFSLVTQVFIIKLIKWFLRQNRADQFVMVTPAYVAAIPDDLQLFKWQKWDLVSISPTFLVRLFCTKVLYTAFLYLRFRFVLFWRKNTSAKAAQKCWWNLPLMCKKVESMLGDFIFKICVYLLNLN